MNRNLIEAAPALLESCKELREAAAAMMRVLSRHPQLADDLQAELSATSGVSDGFGVRAQHAIARAEGRAVTMERGWNR